MRVRSQDDRRLGDADSTRFVDAGLTVTEAWPVQTESRGRMNTLNAAALSDSIFFVARRREEAATGEYEADVEPDLHRIARERVVTLWDGGKGIGGADLLDGCGWCRATCVHKVCAGRVCQRRTNAGRAVPP